MIWSLVVAVVAVVAVLLVPPVPLVPRRVVVAAAAAAVVAAAVARPILTPATHGKVQCDKCEMMRLLSTADADKEEEEEGWCCSDSGFICGRAEEGEGPLLSPPSLLNPGGATVGVVGPTAEVAEATEAAEATVVGAVLRGSAGCADGGGQDGAAANGAAALGAVGVVGVVGANGGSRMTKGPLPEVGSWFSRWLPQQRELQQQEHQRQRQELQQDWAPSASRSLCTVSCGGPKQTKIKK